jgi:hypothetical protein
MKEYGGVEPELHTLTWMEVSGYLHTMATLPLEREQPVLTG